MGEEEEEEEEEIGELGGGISFSCTYESLPDISPEASCILIASHLPYVCSICPSLHPSCRHLIPSAASEAEAALDPTTEPFKVAHQGFPGTSTQRL